MRRSARDIERAEERLDLARAELARAVARGSTVLGDLAERWAALDALAPAVDAVIAAARMAAAAHSPAAAINARHPNLAGLLDGVDGDDPDPRE